MKQVADRINVTDLDAAVELMFEKRWTDGLPAIPPTEAAVGRMLSYIKRSPDEVIGPVPPRDAPATIEKIAINCVMAGCKPEYMPIVIAGLEAMLAPEFNLKGIQTTTHCVAPMTIVNGPQIKDLGFHYGDAVFVAGARPNGTIGRALRLIRWNVGGAYPGETDRSTMGHPGEICFCIPENEDENPWEPLHVEQGFKKEQNAVSAFGCESPHHIMTGPGDAHCILNSLSDSMAVLGNNNTHIGGWMLVVIGPRAAAHLVKGGFTSKKQVKEYLFEKARIPVAKLRRGPGVGRDQATDAPTWLRWPIDPEDDDARVPVVRRPEDFVIMVAGGWGAAAAFCAICPGWGYMGGQLVTRLVTPPGGK
ncbi:MAG: hypothetical protein Q7T26_05880 [Dehalococcoidia bacterium]|nr:hypothetical protein [Dehalococcoidia bacterium]